MGMARPLVDMRRMAALPCSTNALNGKGGQSSVCAQRGRMWLEFGLSSGYSGGSDLRRSILPGEREGRKCTFTEP